MLNGGVAYLAAAPLAILIVALRMDRRRTVVALVALAHVTVLASVALFPLPVDPVLLAEGRAAAGGQYAGATLNLVPFATLGPALAGRAGPDGREIAILNTLVLAPAGVYLPLLFARLGRWRSFLPVALVLGASVEAAQLVVSTALGFRYRTIDIDDVILNTVGLVLGYAAVRAARRAGA